MVIMDHRAAYLGMMHNDKGQRQSLISLDREKRHGMKDSESGDLLWQRRC